eukprot:2583646-Prymnesium_polylepis.1
MSVAHDADRLICSPIRPPTRESAPGCTQTSPPPMATLVAVARKRGLTVLILIPSKTVGVPTSAADDTNSPRQKTCQTRAETSRSALKGTCAGWCRGGSEGDHGIG